MLYTIVVILLILWVVNVLTGFTTSGLIHLLLVVAVVVLILRLLQGRKL